MEAVRVAYTPEGRHNLIGVLVVLPRWILMRCALQTILSNSRAAAGATNFNAHHVPTTSKIETV
jgi:hypothetical protein